MSRTLPLRTELAITFTGDIPLLAFWGRAAAISGRTILILTRFASLFRNPDEGKVTDPSPWWDRDVYADRRPFLLARGRILSALREWFRKRGFLEVETPALQVSPGNEVHLHAFATELVTPAADRQPLYLHTSPEFTCKKLLAAGEARVFSLAHVFRNRERGPLHHPEFTMLEWYRTNEPYEALMAGLRGDPRSRPRRRRARCNSSGRTAPPIPMRRPSGSASPTLSRNSPASICWRR